VGWGEEDGNGKKQKKARNKGELNFSLYWGWWA